MMDRVAALGAPAVDIFHCLAPEISAQRRAIIPPLDGLLRILHVYFVLPKLKGGNTNSAFIKSNQSV
jgi:hypothetical protein